MNATTSDRIQGLARELRDAERSVRVMRTLAWPADARASFLASGGTELPKVTYPAFDPADVLALTASIRRRAPGENPVEQWLVRIAAALETSARMLAAAGTPELYEHARRLYGEPQGLLQDGKSTSLQLAHVVDEMWGEVRGLDLGAPPAACHLATGVAERMRKAVTERFGAAAPEVVVVDELSANALAGPQAIRLRRNACFTDRDVVQLIHHEAFVHVCTSLNGRAQAQLPILGAGHAGTTRTQEGLAVLAEYLSGGMEPDRLRRLADRVLAIQMAIEGADFPTVYRFFQERTGQDEQAFENARRVFRGGDLAGGAPFTKDVVYLDGLIRVTNFLRAAVAQGRVDALLLLFCGKLDLEDIPALATLTREGLCRPPTFLPPWVEDRRFLVAYLAYSRFLGDVDFKPVLAHYQELLGHC